MEPDIDIPETRQMPPKQAQYLYEAVSVSVIERQIPNTAQNDASYLGLAQVGLRRLLHRSALPILVPYRKKPPRPAFINSGLHGLVAWLQVNVLGAEEYMQIRE